MLCILHSDVAGRKSSVIKESSHYNLPFVQDRAKTASAAIKGGNRVLPDCPEDYYEFLVIKLGFG